MHQTACSPRSRVATYHSIGLREDGTIACWGAGTICGTMRCTRRCLFTQVAAGRLPLASASGKMAPSLCWGLNNYWGQCDAPDGVFTQVAAGPGPLARPGGKMAPLLAGVTASMASAMHQTWRVHAGRGWRLPLPRPPGRRHHCMLRAITQFGQCDAPDGAHSRRSRLAVNHSLGLREDGTIACWGTNELRPMRSTKRRVHAGRR